MNIAYSRDDMAGKKICSFGVKQYSLIHFINPRLTGAPIIGGIYYMGRSPNYGRNSNILIPDPYH